MQGSSENTTTFTSEMDKQVYSRVGVCRAKHKAIALFLFALLLCSGSVGRAQAWRPLGLANESISVINVDRQEPKHIVVGSSSNFSEGTQGGIFQSTDSGASWDTLLRGIDVTAIVMHPQSAETLFVCGGAIALSVPGILMSTDGGSHWAWADSGIWVDWETSLVTLAINPKNPRVMYAGTVGFYGGGVFKTTNGGSFWEFKSFPDNEAAKIVLDPECPETVYVATSFFGNLWQSKHGGDDWEQLFSGGGHGMVEDVILLGDTIFLRTTSKNTPLWRSLDRGRAWAPCGIDPTVMHPKSSLVVKRQPRLAMFLSAVEGMFRSEDAGDSWQLEYPVPWRELEVVLAIDAIERNLYAGLNRPGPGPGGLYTLDISTQVPIAEEPMPQSLLSLSCFPNPFNGAFRISYNLPSAAIVRIGIYTMLGGEVLRMPDRWEEQGVHSISITPESLASGVYLVAVSAGLERRAHKVILLR